MKNANVEWSLIFNTAQEVRCVLNVIAKKYGKICFDYFVSHETIHSLPFCQPQYRMPAEYYVSILSVMWDY